jgi:hypothetical protein
MSYATQNPTITDTRRRDPAALAQQLQHSIQTQKQILLDATDAFMILQTPTSEEGELYTQCVLRVLPHLEIAEIIALSQKLTALPTAPKDVLLALMRTTEQAAFAVIVGCSDLSAPHKQELVFEAARMQSLGVARALAARHDLPQEGADILIERGFARSEEILITTLLKNHQAILARHSLEVILKAAKIHTNLAHLLLTRKDLSDIDKAALYLYADIQQRRFIIEALDKISALDRNKNTHPLATDQQMEALIEAARTGSEPLFHQMLADASFSSAREVEYILQDESGELLAFLLLLSGFDAEDAAAIFLSRAPHISHSVERIFFLVRRVRHTSRATARRILYAVMGREMNAMQTSAKSHIPALEKQDRINRSFNVIGEAPHMGVKKTTFGTLKARIGMV